MYVEEAKASKMAVKDDNGVNEVLSSNSSSCAKRHVSTYAQCALFPLLTNIPALFIIFVSHYVTNKSVV
jgi:hypothetical protein